MMSSLARRGLLAALIASASIAGCKCGPKVNQAGCSSDQDCVEQNGGNARWYCSPNKTPPACDLQPMQCDTAADCCPGQACNATGHYCYDKYTPCVQDGSCPAKGQVCQTIGVFVRSQGCTFNRCGPGDSCADGTSCFNKYCVGELPCNAISGATSTGRAAESRTRRSP